MSGWDDLDDLYQLDDPDYWRDESVKQDERIEELEAENERLRAALRPFAKIYNDYRFLAHTVDMKHMRQDTMRHHYKQAAEALEGEQ